MLQDIPLFDGCLDASMEHSKNIIEINSALVKDISISESVEHMDKSRKFKCAECKEIVSLDDKFNEDLKDNQMCKLCTRTAEYGE